MREKERWERNTDKWGREIKDIGLEIDVWVNETSNREKVERKNVILTFPQKWFESSIKIFLKVNVCIMSD